MTKTVTLVDGKTTLLETEKITGIHDRGVQDGKPVVKIHRGSEPAIFVFSTEEDIASKTADITIDL